MRKDELHARAQTLLARLREDVKTARDMRRTDPLGLAEDVICPVLKEAYDLPDLKNLNVTEHPAFPAVDLADRGRRVAVQVTAHVSTRKVEQTLERFFRHHLNEDFDRLLLLSLDSKQTSYPTERIAEQVLPGFDFRVGRDIIDLSDVTERVAQLETKRIGRVVAALEEELGSEPRLGPAVSERQPLETLTANLIEVQYPDGLYVADLAIDRDGLIEATWETEDVRSLQRRASWYQVVSAALRLDGHPPVKDYVLHGGQLITFHDLKDQGDSFHDLVDPGTIDETECETFYEADEGYRRVFASLLARTLTQCVYSLGVRYHTGRRMYFFAPGEDVDVVRREQWGNRATKRKVYDPTLREDGSLWYAKHLAFRARFYLFDGRWHLALSPDWYFSADGWYEPYAYAGDKVSWLKRREHNPHVITHFRFINQFMRRRTPGNLFSHKSRAPYPYFSLGKGVRFDGAPRLDDDAWRPNEPPVKQERLEEGQRSLDLTAD